ncbi:MAG TPA: hypothetical protein VGK74_12045 [Symbiobacteriaceae bacterium]
MTVPTAADPLYVAVTVAVLAKVDETVAVLAEVDEAVAVGPLIETSKELELENPTWLVIVCALPSL